MKEKEKAGIVQQCGAERRTEGAYAGILKITCGKGRGSHLVSQQNIRSKLDKEVNLLTW